MPTYSLMEINDLKSFRQYVPGKQPEVKQMGGPISAIN